MGQVVHVIDAACGLDALLEAAQLAGPDQPLMCIGPPPAWDDSPPRFGLPAPMQTVSVWGLRGRRRRKLRDLIPPQAVPLCWSISAAAALRAAGDRAGPAPLIRLTAAAEPQLHELHRLSESTRPTVVCIHTSIAEALAGVAPATEVKVIGPLACRVPAGKARRARARKRLGLADEQVAIAAPGPVERGSGHRMAVWATAILTVAEVAVRLVMQETGRAARQAANFARQAGFAEQTILAPPQVPLPELLAAADVAVFLGPDRLPPVHLASAMAAGLPIVAADTPAAGEWLAFGRSALPAAADKPRDVARALLRVIEDKALGARLGRSARQAAKRKFDPQSIRRQWADLYAAVSAPAAGRAGG